MPASYADIIKAMNTKHRDPAACTPIVCDVWRAQGDDGQMLINAILGFETVKGRRAKEEDEAEVRAILADLLAKRKAA